jgi:hypothetical protein
MEIFEYKPLLNNCYRTMNKSMIENWLNRYATYNYIIHDNLTVDVDGDIYIENCCISKLYFKFGKITGDFKCSCNNLTSLKNCPDYVGGQFNCSNNKLTSLKYCPSYVGGYFNCSFNKLSSLQYCPSYVGFIFNCYGNRLSNIKELFEIRSYDDIVIDEHIKQTSEYKLLMKLRKL